MAGKTTAQRIRMRDLATLQALAETGSMARAAAALGMTQPAISKAVAGLEDLLGVTLLERSVRGVTLTEYGRILLRHGRVAADALAGAVQEIGVAADPAAGLVRVGTTEPMADLIATIVERLSARAPRIRYAVTLSDTDRLVRDLRERALDLVVTRWVEGTVAPDLLVEHLFTTQLAVMAGHRHRLVRRRHIDLAALMDEAWVLSPPDSYLGRLVGLGFAAHGLAMPTPTLVTLSIYMRLCLLASGRFLTVLPRQILRHPTNRPWLRELQVDLAGTAGGIAMLTLRDRHVTGAARLFAEASRLVAAEAGDTVLASAAPAAEGPGR